MVTTRSSQEAAASKSSSKKEGAEAETEAAGSKRKSPHPTHGQKDTKKHKTKGNHPPSNILEKGLIYFFFRGRVGIETPHTVTDIARSYIVMRPLPNNTSLSAGPIPAAGNARLLVLPKKVLPKSRKDRFTVFVEKGNTSHDELKTFMDSNDYETKTVGTRHTPAATPVAEGVYAVTETGERSGRTSHLAYMITIPRKLGKVQKDLGLSERGSFIASVKNPKYEGPANANLPEGPDLPQRLVSIASFPYLIMKALLLYLIIIVTDVGRLLDEFRNLRWAPLKPEFLDYKNTQMLLIGEGQGGLGKAGEQTEEDAEKGATEPVEEMERLEEYDEERIKNLKGTFIGS